MRTNYEHNDGHEPTDRAAARRQFNNENGNGKMLPDLQESASPMKPLTAKERRKLELLEGVILKGVEDVGKALMEIRDGHLYRDGFKTFGAYVKETFDISRPEAYRKIARAEVNENLLPLLKAGKISALPKHASQAIVLSKIDDPDDQCKAWAQALERAEDTGEDLTAKSVLEAVYEVRPDLPRASKARKEAAQDYDDDRNDPDLRDRVHWKYGEILCDIDNLFAKLSKFVANRTEGDCKHSPLNELTGSLEKSLDLAEHFNEHWDDYFIDSGGKLRLRVGKHDSKDLPDQIDDEDEEMDDEEDDEPGEYTDSAESDEQDEMDEPAEDVLNGEGSSEDQEGSDDDDDIPPPPDDVDEELDDQEESGDEPDDDDDDDDEWPRAPGL